MAEIDTIANLLLEESKRFLEVATLSDDDIGKTAFLHAALMLGFSSVTSYDVV